MIRTIRYLATIAALGCASAAAASPIEIPVILPNTGGAAFLGQSERQALEIAQGVINAAGGINAKFRVGDFMALTDHINFMGANPLRGPEPAGLNRFTDLTAAYDPALRAKVKQAAKAAGAKCHEGVYLAVSGPSFETPAEIRAFRTLGADAVGMSTVPEAIVARQCGVKVAGISCITNAAAGLGGKGQVVSHLEVLELAKQREAVATKLVGEFVRRTA